ncbi:MAG: type II toxin-antitoxin system VapC family toxin [Sporichthyaceae bacterium]
MPSWVLDTNVLSELARPQPSAAVLRWFDAHPSPSLATTAITAAELLCGVARLPRGSRREQLTAVTCAVLEADFDGRVLPFDVSAAVSYAAIVVTRAELGRPISAPDAQIAAICRSRGAALATRNRADFTGIGVELIDPWNG